MRKKTREPIYIVGEGITEKYYFMHLKKIRCYSCVVKPRFFVKTSIDDIQKTTEKLLQGDVTVICVFDADIAERSNRERDKIRAFREKYSKISKVIICDSLPSIEFWFLLHFKKTNKRFATAKKLEKELSEHLRNYKKTEKYLSEDNWVQALDKKLFTAVENAKSTGKSGSYSHIYRAINLLEKKRK